MSKTIMTLAASLAIAAGLTLPSAPAKAEPGGCLKYGAVGAVGGHLAHHGVLGAAGGCVTGMMVRHRYRRSERQDAEAYRNGEGTRQGDGYRGDAPRGDAPREDAPRGDYGPH